MSLDLREHSTIHPISEPKSPYEGTESYRGHEITRVRTLR